MTPVFVTVGQFDDPATANIARGRLEASGIEAVLKDEATVGLAWHWNPATGGIRLQVRTEDEEQARLLLVDQADGPDMEGSLAADDDSDSTDTGPREKTARRAFLAGVIGLVISPLLVYSLVLIVRVVRTGGELSPGAKSKLWFVGVLDVLVLAGLIWFYASLG